MYKIVEFKRLSASLERLCRMFIKRSEKESIKLLRFVWIHGNNGCKIEPPHEKTINLRMRKQRRRSASRSSR